MRIRQCGLCGKKKNLVGPYAGGPYAWYCKSCREIIDEFHDTKIYEASCFSDSRNEILRKYIEAIKKHEAFMQLLIQDFKVSKGMELIFDN